MQGCSFREKIVLEHTWFIFHSSKYYDNTNVIFGKTFSIATFILSKVSVVTEKHLEQ